ncbi:SMI1/KNR4 family protein, partial [Klebsiella pneumoniae]|nr:SMI1/KNR4 family protein [Klebsiella pneumoniae]
EFDKDLFVLCLPNSSRSGEIIWFAGEEIDRFKNFDEYFLAMVDYNREEILALKNYIQ